MSNFHTDVIIVGSGIAGALCAYELSKHHIPVTMVEAGSWIDRQTIVRSFYEAATLDFSSGFPNEPRAPRPDTSTGTDNYLQYSQTSSPQNLEYLSAVGGTTWHWSGTSLYGVGSDWPITYADLEPFYTQAEWEIGVAGDDHADYGVPRSKKFPMPAFPPSYGERYIAEQLKSLDIPFIAAPSARNSIPYDGRSQCQGFGTCSPICPSGAQYNASVHVKKAADLGCRVIDNARVNKILVDENKRINGVRFIDSTGQQQNLYAKIVILAANGIETPKLLLMSANDFFPQGIANQSRQVGKNLFGHPGMACNMLSPIPLYLGRGPDHTLLSFKYCDGEIRKKRSAWSLSVSNGIPLHKTHIAAIDVLEHRQLLPPAADNAIQYQVAHAVTLGCMFEQLPDERNGITLDWNKRDSGNHPTCIINWHINPYEINGAEAAKEILASIGRTLKGSNLDFVFPLQHHHPMGTTRMGLLPSNSVVDANGKAHDHDNLYIISSSVFPTGGTVNPTLTIAALSLRTAETIRRRLKSE
jgi:choline dehydrogenase-like flavoprotein